MRLKVRESDAERAGIGIWEALRGVFGCSEWTTETKLGQGVALWRAQAYTWRMLPVTLYVDTPRPALTANDARSKCHWTILRAKKAEMAWQVAQACKAAKIGRLGSTPIDVTITWFVTDNRRRDNDALGPFTKAALDTLVDRGVIDDDNYRIVRSTKQRVRQSDTARIEILLREEQEDD